MRHKQHNLKCWCGRRGEWGQKPVTVSQSALSFDLSDRLTADHYIIINTFQRLWHTQHSRVTHTNLQNATNSKCLKQNKIAASVISHFRRVSLRNASFVVHLLRRNIKVATSHCTWIIAQPAHSHSDLSLSGNRQQWSGQNYSLWDFIGCKWLAIQRNNGTLLIVE